MIETKSKLPLSVLCETFGLPIASYRVHHQVLLLHPARPQHLPEPETLAKLADTLAQETGLRHVALELGGPS